jgi:hypothetical protein
MRSLPTLREVSGIAASRLRAKSADREAGQSRYTYGGGIPGCGKAIRA